MLVESRILSFGIWNSPQGICNPTNDWNGESKFHWKGFWNLQRGIQNCLGLLYYPALQLVHGARLYAEQLLLHQVFVQHCWRSIPATYMCSNLFLDHNVFLHLKVGVCPTFCNLCCYVKEEKLLPKELFDVTTKGLCVHTTFNLIQIIFFFDRCMAL